MSPKRGINYVGFNHEIYHYWKTAVSFWHSVIMLPKLISKLIKMALISTFPLVIEWELCKNSFIKFRNLVIFLQQSPSHSSHMLYDNNEIKNNLNNDYDGIRTIIQGLMMMQSKSSRASKQCCCVLQLFWLTIKTNSW